MAAALRKRESCAGGAESRPGTAGRAGSGWSAARDAAITEVRSRARPGRPKLDVRNAANRTAHAPRRLPRRGGPRARARGPRRPRARARGRGRAAAERPPHHRRHAARRPPRLVRLPAADHAPDRRARKARRTLRRRDRPLAEDLACDGGDGDEQGAAVERHPAPPAPPAPRGARDARRGAPRGRLRDGRRGRQREPGPRLRLPAGLRPLRRVVGRRGAALDGPRELPERARPGEALHQRDARHRSGPRGARRARRRAGEAVLSLAALHRPARAVRAAARVRASVCRRAPVAAGAARGPAALPGADRPGDRGRVERPRLLRDAVRPRGAVRRRGDRPAARDARGARPAARHAGRAHGRPRREPAREPLLPRARQRALPVERRGPADLRARRPDRAGARGDLSRRPSRRDADGARARRRAPARRRAGDEPRASPAPRRGRDAALRLHGVGPGRPLAALGAQGAVEARPPARARGPRMARAQRDRALRPVERSGRDARRAGRAPRGRSSARSSPGSATRRATRAAPRPT